MSAYFVQRPSTNLCDLRLRAGLSGRALARLARLSQSSVRYAERGVGVPHPQTQLKIARALSVSLGETVTVLDLWPLAEDEDSNGVAA
jgi:transcriptional regulator with XRE-family HTH domain